METRQEKSMRYLLGKLTEQETAEFEAQCFEDDSLFHEMTDLENDLLHSYVRDELSTTERKEFEAGYLISPARRRKVEFVQALEHHLFGSAERTVSGKEDQPPPKRMARANFAFQSWQVSIVSAALVAIAAIAWLVVMNYRLKSELQHMQAQQAELRRAQQELETKLATFISRQGTVANPDSQPQHPELPGQSMIAFNLTPGLPRSAGAIHRLMVPPRVARVALNLYLEDDKYSTYRASLETAAGKQIWRKSAMKSRPDSQGRRIISCEIPSGILSSGDYVIKLDGIPGSGEVEKDIAAYRFAVAGR
jgi:hypothetical protein